MTHADANWWNHARYAAGLTHGDAARLLGVPLGALVAISEGRADPLPWLADRMLEVYGLAAPIAAKGGA